uniref:Uncharacterized protein n=1 Tax=Oryza nivara TaxID=4536 RepID=A0A0E0HTN2_ORYNI
MAGPGRPRMARLQFARRPSITGYGSMHAILAESGSRKGVTRAVAESRRLAELNNHATKTNFSQQTN